MVTLDNTHNSHAKPNSFNTTQEFFHEGTESGQEAMVIRGLVGRNTFDS